MSPVHPGDERGLDLCRLSCKRLFLSEPFAIEIRIIMNFEERLKIQEGSARLANSFDIQHWDALQAGLTESRDADYSDVRGTPPQTMTVSEYLRQRRSRWII